MKNLIIIVLLQLLALGAFAQDSTKQQEITRMPGQVTFITPLGTNGMESGRTINQFSLNVFYGYHYGLEGFEFSGFMSTLKDDMYGAQIAGFSNVVLDSVNGIQLAGFYNHAGNSAYGVQIAGFSNTAVNNAGVGQIAGFGNVVNGNLTGAQLGGFGNIVTGELDGIQAAGFGNIVNGNSKGAHLSGFGSLVKGDLQGSQISGFMNVATGSVEGMQIAGFSNTVRDSMTGTQISGFVNFAHKLTGSQIGFINIADTIKNGVAIGFISYAKNGYHKIEAGTNESFHGFLSLKTGTDHFYNIFSAGAHFEEEDYLMWGFGYGIGGIVMVTDKLGLNLEAISYHINQNEWFTYDLNLLNRANFNILWRPGQFELSAGPSFNVFLTDRIDSEDIPMGPNILPDYNYFYDYSDDDIYLRMYPGFNIAVRL